MKPRPKFVVRVAIVCLCAYCTVVTDPERVFAQEKTHPRRDEAAESVPVGESPGFEPDKPSNQLTEITITASPLPRSLFETAQPVTSVGREDIVRQGAYSLGQALASEPGISSSDFGAASRPVIRGLGGERVRVLENGVGTLDVSNISPDHAVALDPTLTEKVEVVRGPATLLYGPNAISGVVNVIDERIPEERLEKPTGHLHVLGATADNQRGGGASMTAPVGSFALYLEGFYRKSDDYEIPGFARAGGPGSEGAPGDGAEAHGKLPFSYQEAEGASVGGSFPLGEDGLVGLSGTLFNTAYGLPNGEPDVSINLRQRRLDFRARVPAPVPFVRMMEVRGGVVDYEHTEYEAGSPGTVFRNSGIEGRWQVDHKVFGPVEGSAGVQYQYTDFSALGEEAFQPPVKTNVYSGFVFEEVKLSDTLRYQVGGRIDALHAAALRAALDEGAGKESKSFTALSAATGLVWFPAEHYAAALSITRTERPPAASELFAGGPHLATNAFEIGDSTLGKERAVGTDLTFRRKAGVVTGSVGGFVNRFSDYIALSPNGGEEDGLPVYRFRPLAATFWGLEAHGHLHLLGPAEDHDDFSTAKKLALGDDLSKRKREADRLDLTVQWDYVRARERGGDLENLPRIPPLRGICGVEYQREEYFARAEVQHVFKQDDVAPLETETAEYTTANAVVSRRLTLPGSEAEVFLRANNIFDEEVRNHVSFIKDMAPLAGRNLVLGMRLMF